MKILIIVLIIALFVPQLIDLWLTINILGWGYCEYNGITWQSFHKSELYNL